eukprot:TRINITY_DN5213_c0_g1_i2.p1 TRINITY_DN5213_c0_g1~~TRINITY_DN5213_c0_g1_i2.p1  ORF type:complete len:360 (+),score=71.31 TRINITY_DN5213_c0_g1_i2:294-1373(+)
MKNELRWEVIYNDTTDENLLKLIYLKDIISRQLPNMPKNYITRLVFDESHKSLIGIVGKDTVIGGITFKTCSRDDSPSFIEVVFCVITSLSQIRGYGSRLMNHLKKYCIDNGIYDMLTYADDSAIGYFRRQGYTLEVNLPKKHWNIGFLKHYDSATLMHCHLEKRINYLEITYELRQQREYLMELLQEYTHLHNVYSGIPFDDLDIKLARLDTLEFFLETGWDVEKFQIQMDKENLKEIYHENKELINRIKEDEVSWPFKAPVVELFPQEAEKYLQAIPDPIDLRTIEENLESGLYVTREMLLSDLQRMVDNCKKYNPKKSGFYGLAETINTKYLKDLQTHIVKVQEAQSRNLVKPQVE